MNHTISALIVHVPGGNVELTKQSLITNGCEDFQVLQASELKQIDVVCSKLKGDYVLLLSSSFQLTYDDVLYDAQELVKNSSLVCFGTNYELDATNKYDPQWRHPLSTPTLSSVLSNPSAYIAVLISKRALLDNSWIHFTEIISVYEFCLCLLLKYGIKQFDCRFIAYNIITGSLHADDINNTIDVRRLVSFLCEANPFLAKEISLLFNRYISVPKEIVQVSDKIYKTRLFKAILAFRWLLKQCGYYTLKAAIRKKQYLQKVRKEDSIRIADIEKRIYSLPKNMLQQRGDSSDIVVSLTTHGKRFSESAPFAIYSLFTQSVLPNRIVISVDEKAWDDENLPPLIRRLQLSGLEVLYCRDVRSHTKLLPALSKYKDNPIITVDDDMYYEPKMIEELINAYLQSDKKTVLCRQGVVPKKHNGEYLPYMQWVEASIFEDCEILGGISPLGVSGVLYPPHIFDDEIFKEDIFLRLAPHTDDIWFWVMEVRSNIKAKLVQNAPIQKDISISMIEYLVEEESTALYFQNCFSGRNDKELKSLIDYYNL